MVQRNPSVRSDNALLEDILLAADDVAAYLAGMSRQDFLEDSKTQAAVERKMMIMGEAANRLSAELTDKNPSALWSRIVNIRNFYVHGYDRLSPEEVWGTSRKLIPRVARLVAGLLPPEVE